MNEAAKEKTSLQWHPAFYAGIQIEFAEEAHHLVFENEHQLGTKPKEIDVLIIKKDSNVSIRKNIGRIFRTHNIIEYKSPEDYLSIDDFYKVHGYACFYKSDVSKIDEIKAREITISFVTKHYPRNVIKHLEREQHLEVGKQEKGIYYVYGDYFPIQFVVTSQLTDEMNFWLHNLTNDLKETSRADNIMNKYKSHENDNLHQSVMDIIVSANKEVFKEADDMCQALNKLREELIEEHIQKLAEERVEELAKERAEELAKERAEKLVQAQLQEQLQKNKERTLMSLVRDGLLSITEAAKRLSMSDDEIIQKLNSTE